MTVAVVAADDQKVQLVLDGLTITNKFFFASTQAVVKAAQKELGLTVDGKAGKQTITALGGVWRG